MQGSRSRIEGSQFRVRGSRFQVSNFGCQVSGFEFKDPGFWHLKGPPREGGAEKGSAGTGVDTPAMGEAIQSSSIGRIYKKTASIQNFLAMTFTARTLHYYSQISCGVINLIARIFRIEIPFL